MIGLLLLSYLLVVVAGLGTVALLAGKKRLRWTEYGALSWLVGGGVISLATFLFGLALTGIWLRGATTVLALGLGALGWRAWRGTRPLARGPRWAELAPLLILGGMMGYAAWLAPRVAFGWDAMMIWEAKSFMAFQYGGTLPPNFYIDNSVIFTWPFYPLYLPYLQSWIYGWIGSPNQSALAGFPALFLGSASLLLHATVRGMGGPRWLAAIIMTGFWGAPYLLSGYWGLFSGYADFPLAVVLLAAVWAALWWQESREPAALRMLAFVSALLPWVKREGQYLWVAVLVVPGLLLLRERRWRQLVQVALPGFSIMLMWKLYLTFRAVVADPTFQPFTVDAMKVRVGPILGVIFGEMFARDHWGCLWIVTSLALVALIFSRRWTLVGLLACVLILPLGVATLAYVCSTWKNFLAHVYLSIQRLVLQLVPVALLTIALACPWIKKRSAEAWAGESELAPGGEPEAAPEPQSTPTA
jgi:hypothetical protein